MASEIVAVFGGTGTIGHHLVPRLCELLAKRNDGCPHVVRVLTRDVEAARVKFADLKMYVDAGGPVVIELVPGSVEDPSSLTKFLEGATRVFLLTLTSLTHRQCAIEGKILNLMGLHCKLSGSEQVSGASPGASVRHIVRLSAHSRGMEGQPSNSPFRWHSDCDEQLIRCCDPAHGCARDVKYSILRPSLFMQDMTRRHFAPVIRTSDTFYQLGKVDNSTGKIVDSYRIAMVDARDIADVAACTLSEPVDKHAYNTYILSGPKALLWTDVAEAISAVCGRTVTATMLGDREFHQRFGQSHLYLKQMQAYRSGCGEDVDCDIEVVTGCPARSIEQFAVDHRNSWVTE